MHRFDFEDCSTDICFFVLCCVVSFVLFVCVLCVYFLTSFMFDCCMTEFVDLRNDACVCVCMYVCMYVLCMYAYMYFLCVYYVFIYYK